MLPVAIPEEDKEEGKEIITPHGSAPSPDRKEFGKELYAQLEGYVKNGDIKVRNCWCLHEGNEADEVCCHAAEPG